MSQKPHTFNNKTAELTARLQKEVDNILSNLNDAHLYSEFKDDELVDVTGDIYEQRMREALEERINHNISRRSHRAHLLHKTVNSTVNKTYRARKKVHGFFDFLFKPFAF